MKNDFYYKFIEPEQPLTNFVENFGMFHNQSDSVKEVILLPDGRIDLLFLQSESKSFRIVLVGLEILPKPRSIPPNTLAFVISFKPLAVEYILQTSIADILNGAKELPINFWNFDPFDLNDFSSFHKKASQKIQSLLSKETDTRKHKLFESIYASNGEMSVKELSEKVSWGSRQINRYFSRQFGLSLKVYCSILRFRASLAHIAQRKLFPELNFADQTHFIREIKKFSGVAPKELSKNKNDRFVLLSVLKQQ